MCLLINSRKINDICAEKVNRILDSTRCSNVKNISGSPCLGKNLTTPILKSQNLQDRNPTAYVDVGIAWPRVDPCLRLSNYALHNRVRLCH